MLADFPSGMSAVEQEVGAWMVYTGAALVAGLILMLDQ